MSGRSNQDGGVGRSVVSEGVGQSGSGGIVMMEGWDDQYGK